MKKEELRIGNTFIEKYSNTIIHVTGLTDTGIYFTGSFEGKWQAEPVQLTEDWLLKFGFYNGNKQLANCDLWDKHWKNELEIFKSDNKFYHELNCMEIKSVHQLQNLYFALTGEELQFT